VCKLLKSLYGLKQAPKELYEKFDKTMTSASFVVNEADKYVYYRYGGVMESFCAYMLMTYIWIKPQCDRGSKEVFIE